MRNHPVADMNRKRIATASAAAEAHKNTTSARLVPEARQTHDGHGPRALPLLEHRQLRLGLALLLLL
jgi:hypothetical protein